MFLVIELTPLLIMAPDSFRSQEVPAGFEPEFFQFFTGKGAFKLVALVRGVSKWIVAAEENPAYAVISGEVNNFLLPGQGSVYVYRRVFKKTGLLQAVISSV